jgi:hypothetical protein
MTVRVFLGNIALFSFVQSQNAAVNKADENGRFLVVGVWVAYRERHQWQVARIGRLSRNKEPAPTGTELFEALIATIAVLRRRLGGEASSATHQRRL